MSWIRGLMTSQGRHSLSFLCVAALTMVVTGSGHCWGLNYEENLSDIERRAAFDRLPGYLQPAVRLRGSAYHLTDHDIQDLALESVEPMLRSTVLGYFNLETNVPPTRPSSLTPATQVVLDLLNNGWFNYGQGVLSVYDPPVYSWVIDRLSSAQRAKAASQSLWVEALAAIYLQPRERVVRHLTEAASRPSIFDPFEVLRSIEETRDFMGLVSAWGPPPPDVEDVIETRLRNATPDCQTLERFAQLGPGKPGALWYDLFAKDCPSAPLVWLLAWRSSSGWQHESGLASFASKLRLAAVPEELGQLAGERHIAHQEFWDAVKEVASPALVRAMDLALLEASRAGDGLSGDGDWESEREALRTRLGELATRHVGRLPGDTLPTRFRPMGVDSDGLEHYSDEVSRLQFIRVPAGLIWRSPSYRKGRPLAVARLARSRTPVYVRSFLLSTMPVTREALARVSAERRSWMSEPDAGSVEASSLGLGSQSAAAVCRMLGGRLPTEGEWERASAVARALKSPAWAQGGSVMEFCGDWFGEEHYLNEVLVGGTGPSSDQGFGRVVRGGDSSRIAESSLESHSTRPVLFRLAFSLPGQDVAAH